MNRAADRPVRRKSWRPVSAVLSLVLGVGLVGLPAPLAVPPAAAAAAPGLTFSGHIRITNVDAIFTANADGTGARRISPDDGRDYNWGRFAFGNTKIIYTVNAKGDPTHSIGLMNPDGSDPQIIRSFEYQLLQPQVDPSGRYVYYTAKPPFFPKAAMFRLNLATGVATNLTVVGRSKGTYDADPFLFDDGNGLLFVENTAGRGTTIGTMDSDGSDRTELTDSKQYFYTDPSMSPNGKQMAIASYRGYDQPPQGEPVGSAVPVEYFYVSVQEPRKGAPETLLTDGRNCLIRTSDDPCEVEEMSGFVPRFTPDGNSVSFTGAIDEDRTCVCAIGVDGSSPRRIFTSNLIGIGFHDWPQPDGYSTSTDHIGSEQRASELLLLQAAEDKVKHIVIAAPDMATRTTLTLPDGLQPIEARWGPTTETIVFTARIKLAKRPPWPEPPAGSTRRVHPAHADPNRLSSSVAEKQIFLYDRADDSVKRLTDPWMEDWRDGLRSGDARGNTQPRFSPDGRHLFITNTSTLSGETFLLQYDMKTERVRNMTRVTRESVPSDDGHSAVTPDGKHLTFSRVVGSVRSLYVMDERTGTDVRTLRSDRYSASSPAWTPNGRYMFFVSKRSEGTLILRSSISSGPTAGTTKTFSGSSYGPSAPVVAPEGDRVAFLHRGRVYSRPPTGSKGPRVIQPDLTYRFSAVDWGKP